MSIFYPQSCLLSLENCICFPIFFLLLNICNSLKILGQIFIYLIFVLGGGGGLKFLVASWIEYQQLQLSFFFFLFFGSLVVCIDLLCLSSLYLLGYIMWFLSLLLFIFRWLILLVILFQALLLVQRPISWLLPHGTIKYVAGRLCGMPMFYKVRPRRQYLMINQFCARLGRTMEQLYFLQAVTSKPKCGLCCLALSQPLWLCMMHPSKRFLGFQN